MEDRALELIMSEQQALISKQESEIFYLKSIIKKLPENIFWKNKEGIYLGSNDFLIKMTGTTDVNEKNLLDLLKNIFEVISSDNLSEQDAIQNSNLIEVPTAEVSQKSIIKKPPVIKIKSPEKIRANILFVENDPLLQKISRLILKTASCEVDLASDAETALQLAKTKQYDLIILDVELPNVSGSKVAEQLRKWEKLQGKQPIPIVGVITHEASEAARRCLDSGVNAVFSKPISIESAEAILKQFIPAPAPPASPKKAEISPDAKDLSVENALTPEEQFIQLKTYPLFDIEQGIQNTGNRETVIFLLHILLNESIGEESVHIKTAHDQKDWETVRELSHKLKGASLYCGVMRMKNACQFMEKYLKNTGYDNDTAEKIYHQMMQTMEDTRQEIEGFLKNEPL